MANIIAIANQQGGVAKTTTTAILAAVITMRGKRLLLVGANAQGSLTEMLGHSPEALEASRKTLALRLARNVLISNAITLGDPDLIALSDMLGVVDCELISEKASHDLLRNWNLL